MIFVLNIIGKNIEEIVWILYSAFILCVFKSEKDKGKVDEVKV